ncbi:hypothetical protein ABPG72_022798 [Tetrahymena utriculariae]
MRHSSVLVFGLCFLILVNAISNDCKFTIDQLNNKVLQPNTRDCKDCITLDVTMTIQDDQQYITSIKLTPKNNKSSEIKLIPESKSLTITSNIIGVHLIISYIHANPGNIIKNQAIQQNLMFLLIVLPCLKARFHKELLKLLHFRCHYDNLSQLIINNIDYFNCQKHKPFFCFTSKIKSKNQILNKNPEFTLQSQSAFSYLEYNFMTSCITKKINGNLTYQLVFNPNVTDTYQSFVLNNGYTKGALLNINYLIVALCFKKTFV